jgi:hypothetical protein
MLRDVTGIDHVVFGTDYPYLPHHLAVSCRTDIEASPDLTESERTAILGGTATKLIPRLAAGSGSNSRPPTKPSRSIASVPPEADRPGLSEGPRAAG